MSACTVCKSMGKCIMQFAARWGHLECLKYAYGTGQPWDKIVTLCATQYGHLECLKFANENGCPWNDMTFEFAAFNGYIDCLKYAYYNGAPYSIGYALIFAAQNNCLECLNFILDETPVTPNDAKVAIQAASMHGSIDCMLHLYIRGVPWPTQIARESQWHIRRLRIAAIILSRAFRAKIRKKRCDAVSKIEDAWLEYNYKPGNTGYYRMAKRFRDNSCKFDSCL